jgi:hypothetical protein
MGTAGIVTLILVIDLVVMTVLVRAIVSTNWEPIVKKYPAVEPLPDGRRWNFRSFQAGGMLNMGWSVHVVSDVDFLHLRPAKLLRWMGMRPASVPWDEVEVRARKRRTLTVRIAGIDLRGPAECLTAPAEAAV